MHSRASTDTAQWQLQARPRSSSNVTQTLKNVCLIQATMKGRTRPFDICKATAKKVLQVKMVQDKAVQLAGRETRIRTAKRTLTFWPSPL